MKIMKPVLVLAIILFSCTIITKPGSGNLVTSQTIVQPWTISSGWEFTWHISAATTPYIRETDMRFTVHEIVPAIGQSNILNFEGNLSRNIGFDTGESSSWLLMKENTTYAFYNVNNGNYNFSSDAFGDDVFFLPINMENPVALFKEAYSSQCNEPAWNITINETTRTYDAINSTNIRQRVHFDFDSNGAINNGTILWPNGSIKYQMTLTSVYNPNMDITRYFNILTIMLIGAVILIVVVVLLRKYNVKVKDVISGKRPASVTEDDNLDFDESDVPDDIKPE